MDEISFDIVAITGNIVAKNGNNVEATFDIVERIVQLVAFDNVASTLLLVWTGLNVIKELLCIKHKLLFPSRLDSADLIIVESLCTE